MITRTLAALALSAALGLAGCASERKSSDIGAYFDDAATTARVKKALFHEPSLKKARISVTTEAAVVQLTGSVKTRGARVKAGLVARKVEGVKAVRNNLTVE